jgi:uncharacterized integral membrane protein (TIGR00698 family)
MATGHEVGAGASSAAVSPVRRPSWLVASPWPVAAAGLCAAMLLHRLVPQVGVLTWAVGLGVLLANLGLLRGVQLARITKKLLRLGVALLGFSVSLASVAALGFPVIATIVGTLVGTLVFTLWLGGRLGLGFSRSLLLGTGTAICGASAIAAMEETAGADEEDVTAAIAMITLCGTLALVALPLLREPLGLTTLQFGVWSGASVHEVGQVVAAASPMGGLALATAVVVKLTRVLLLAPVVATVGVMRRRTASARRGPIIPIFVVAFLVCAVTRSTGIIPSAALGWIGQVQVAALGAALFGMGASVHLRSLLRKSGALLATAFGATLFIVGLVLVAVLVLVR